MLKWRNCITRKCWNVDKLKCWKQKYWNMKIWKFGNVEQFCPEKPNTDFTISTFQHVNIPKFQHFNMSTLHYVNLATFKHFTIETLHISTFQQQTISKFEDFNIPTFHHFNIFNMFNTFNFWESAITFQLRWCWNAEMSNE